MAIKKCREVKGDCPVCGAGFIAMVCGQKMMIGLDCDHEEEIEERYLK